MKTWIRAGLGLTALVSAVVGAYANDATAPLKIEFPDAYFAGTPIDYWSKNLEPKTGKKPAPFMAPTDATVISKDVKVTSSAAPSIGQLKQIVDGDKDYAAKKSVVELPAGQQWVQLDLGAEKTLYALALWHWHEGDRVFFDVVVQVSNDPEFKKDVKTLYNNDMDNSSALGVGPDKEYYETNYGRVIDLKSNTARYLRLYSNGNNANSLNQYIEAEVWGK